MFKQTIKLENVNISCFRIQSSKGMGMEIHDYLHYMHNYTHEIYLTEQSSLSLFQFFQTPRERFICLLSTQRGTVTIIGI